MASTHFARTIAGGVRVRRAGGTAAQGGEHEMHDALARVR